MEYRSNEYRGLVASVRGCKQRRCRRRSPEGGSASGELDWDGIMAYTASATGWTWDYIEWNLDIPRLVALNAHWQRLPPPALQLARIASFLGIKPMEVEPTKTTPGKNDDQAGS